MSQRGHERRPFKWRLLDNFRYAPGSDRGRVAAQYVAKGQKLTFHSGSCKKVEYLVSLFAASGH
jgi:hypothetical protein